MNKAVISVLYLYLNCLLFAVKFAFHDIKVRPPCSCFFFGGCRNNVKQPLQIPGKINAFGLWKIHSNKSRHLLISITLWFSLVDNPFSKYIIKIITGFFFVLFYQYRITERERKILLCHTILHKVTSHDNIPVSCWWLLVPDFKEGWEISSRKMRAF